ncbi:MAG: type III-A CRISPR-associated protein Cas10/Csm1 [Thermoplasmatales archaeon]
MVFLLSREKREFALALAAILHDIGKVAQRFTPKETHASLGQAFVKNLPNLDTDIRDLVSKLVGEHHLDDIGKSSIEPENRDLLVILQDADRKTASHDRSDRDRDEYREDPKMYNIFEYVSIEGGPPKPSKSKFSLITMETPVTVRSNSKEPLGFNDLSYQKIWSDLKKEISEISQRDYRKFFDALDSILMNYLTFVPSAYFYSEPNITLYDHLRLTAALAVSEFRNKEDGSDETLLFIMGEASGIQNYIFRYVVSESADDKATKRLRGRSFVVRLVTDSVVSFIIDRFNLYRFNVVLEKADGFLVVLNSSKVNIEKLEGIRRDVENGILEFGRGLTIAMSWKQMPLENMESEKNQEFRKVLDTLSQEISTRKRKLLDSSIQSIWDNIFEIEPSRDKRICHFCGYAHAEVDNRCKQCKNEELIGEKLVKKGKLLLRRSEGGFLTLRYGEMVYSYLFVDDGVDEPGDIIYINEFDHSRNRSGGRTILQGNYSPSKDNEVVSLNDVLCPKKESMKRCFYLGVAKTDVDNMGIIVTEGLDPLTLSRYASLSFLMSAFFSVIANQIAEHYDVYIIYSGGDDLSVMGEATAMVDFSMTLRNAFSQWVRNEQITLSSGVSIIDHLFPVRKGIEMAEDNLKNVKATKSKNALGIFDQTIPWNKLADLMNAVDKITGLLSKKNNENSRIGRSFPYVLLELDKENPYNSRFSSEPSPERGKRIRVPDSYLFYYLRRNLSKQYEGQAMQLTRDIAKEEIFANIKFVAYNVIIRLRRGEYE